MKTFIKVLIIFCISFIFELPVFYIMHTGIGHNNMMASASIIYCSLMVGFLVYYICRKIHIKF